VIARLTVGEQVWLRREPDNAYDTNAILVERENGDQLGYLNRQLAARTADLLDDSGGVVPGWVCRLLGGYASYASLGVRIRFQVPRAVYEIDEAPPIR